MPCPFPSAALLRRLLICVLGALAVASGASSGAVAAPLERGDRGERVEKLQSMLGLRADGVFGAGTARAVKRFQRRHDLTADGIVGAGTWRMLRRARDARRAPARSASASTSSSLGGSTRRATRILQRRLGIGVDGVFGPGTLRAVKRYQRRRGMTPDGIVGPATWSALGVRGRRPILKRRGARTARASSGPPRAVLRAVAAANRIARTPYRWGGGHGSFQDSGYDCSGSISYVLHAAGRLGRPRDSSGFESYGAPGRGRWITIYAHGGHAFMVINGRRYDTTGRHQTGSRWQPRMRSTAGYAVRHPPGL